MQFKLSPEEIYWLLAMICEVMLKHPHALRSEKILYLLMDKVRIKLRRKLELREQKNYHSVTLAPEEAIAFEEWMAKVAIIIPKGDHEFALNTAQQMTTKINQKYVRRLNKPHYSADQVHRIG